MASARSQMGRIIQQVDVPDVKLADVSVRPIRLAFLISVQSSIEELLKYINYNTLIWGGIYNFFTPVDNSTILDYWWEGLVQFDPDIVVCCSEAIDELIRRIKDDIQPFSIVSWFDDIAEHHDIGIDKFYSTPMRFVLTSIHAKNRPIEKSGIRLPSCDKTSPFFLCTCTQLGWLEDEDLLRFLENSLKAEKVIIGNGNVEAYLNSILGFLGNTSPLRLTGYQLNISSPNKSGMFLGVTIVLVSDDAFIEDICLFWNWRATIHTLPMGAVGIIALPYNAFTLTSDFEAVGRWIGENMRGANLVTIASTQFGNEKLSDFRDALSPFLPSNMLVDTWFDHFRFIDFRLVEMSTSIEIGRLNTTAMRLSVPHPRWLESARGRSKLNWIVDVQLQTEPFFGPGEGYMPPKYPGLNYLLAGEPNTDYWTWMTPQVRYTKKHLSFLAKASDKFQSIPLSPDEVLFDRYLKSKGYQSQLTDKSRYIQGIIRLLGGLDKAAILQDEGVRELLFLMKDEESLQIADMHQPLRQRGRKTKYEYKEEIEELVSFLALRGVFIRGYKIRCPLCDLPKWYRLDEIGEKMACAGCLSPIQPPLQAQFHYRLNELFRRGIDQGAIPVLLTLNHLAKVSNESFHFVPGIQVQTEKTKLDIDILLSCNGNLVVAECKSLLHGISESNIEKIVNQFKNNIEIATEIGADLVILASILPEVPTYLQEAYNELQKSYPSVKLLLTLKEDLDSDFIYLMTKEGDKKPASAEDLFGGPIMDSSKGRDIRPGERKIGIGSHILSL